MTFLSRVMLAWANACIYILDYKFEKLLVYQKLKYNCIKDIHKTLSNQTELSYFENLVKLATYCLIKYFSTKYSILDRIPSKDDVWKMDMNYLKYTYLGRGNMVETMENHNEHAHLSFIFLLLCEWGWLSYTVGSSSIFIWSHWGVCNAFCEDAQNMVLFKTHFLHMVICNGHLICCISYCVIMPVSIFLNN